MTAPTPSQPISPCLWFDRDAEAAAKYYCSVFPNSSLGRISHYPKNGHPMHKDREGEVLTVSFRLNGQEFLALNGGPTFRFTEAISLMVFCESQEEIDYYWERLGEGGPPESQACGWLKDRFGLSWQIVPDVLMTMMSDPGRAPRVMAAFMQMKKFDIAALKRAYAGG